MKNKEEITEWIDRYLDKKLQGDELLEFENLMKEDNSFSLEVAAQKAIRNTIDKSGDESLKEKFKMFHKEMMGQEGIDLEKEASNPINTPKMGTWWNNRILAVAATVCVFLVAGLIIYNQTKTPDSSSRERESYLTFKTQVIADTSGQMGYTGERQLVDSVVVNLILDRDYVSHYRFRDTLEIFSADLLDQNGVVLYFYPKQNSYILEISGKKYPVIKGLNRILELEKSE